MSTLSKSQPARRRRRQRHPTPRLTKPPPARQEPRVALAERYRLPPAGRGNRSDAQAEAGEADALTILGCREGPSWPTIRRNVSARYDYFPLCNTQQGYSPRRRGRIVARPSANGGLLSPSLSPSEGERVPAKAGEGDSVCAPGRNEPVCSRLRRSRSRSVMDCSNMWPRISTSITERTSVFSSASATSRAGR